METFEEVPTMLSDGTPSTMRVRKYAKEIRGEFLTMKEKVIEAYLKKQVEAHGGEVRKIQWVNRRGAPDRLVLLNGVYFVELKRPGEKLDPHQEREANRLRKQGANVRMIDTLEGVDNFIKEITGNELQRRS